MTPTVARPHQEDGPSCPGPNYSGLCPVCRGDEQGYRDELQFAFGPWHREEAGRRACDDLTEKGVG